MIADRGGGLRAVQLYMCLLFDGANHVRSIEKIQSPEDQAAMGEAARLVRAVRQTIGYELWKDGHKIASYFQSTSATT